MSENSSSNCILPVHFLCPQINGI